MFFPVCSADMSFCRGSVNCHGSDGQMYHFCESSRSGEIFLDQYRGGGVFIPRDKLIRIGLFRSVNRPTVCSERVVTNASHSLKLQHIRLWFKAKHNFDWFDWPPERPISERDVFNVASHAVYTCVPRTCYCDDTINLALGSRGCIALVEHATKGKKHAEKVALCRYLHNIKLKIMLNVYELSYCLVFLFECSIICLGRKWYICKLEAVAR